MKFNASTFLLLFLDSHNSCCNPYDPDQLELCVYTAVATITPSIIAEAPARLSKFVTFHDTWVAGRFSGWPTLHIKKLARTWSVRKVPSRPGWIMSGSGSNQHVTHPVMHTYLFVHCICKLHAIYDLASVYIDFSISMSINIPNNCFTVSTCLFGLLEGFTLSTSILILHFSFKI